MSEASDLHLEPSYAEALRARGFTTVRSLFENPSVKVWRRLPDRENATLDLPHGVRLHVKRYREPLAVLAELRGYRLTVAAGLPTASLAASGTASDGQSVIAFADLAGYAPADKIISSAADFDWLLQPTADLAARLHNARLHHRDLYLCHFLVRAEPFDIKLIDTARVSQLSNPLTRRRWIIKDLAQFWFSTTTLPITDAQRGAWLQAYACHTHQNANRLRKSIHTKVARIARHDQHLNLSQPRRNISIPK